MPGSNIIKAIIPTTCPHCKGSILVEYQVGTPAITSVFTDIDIAKAKEDVRVGLDGLTLNESRKEEVLKWLGDPDTVFGPNEVSSILSSLKTDQT